MTRSRLGLALASLALAGASLRAQDTTRARGDTARLGPVVVTATRSPVRLADAPAAVSVLRGDELRAAGITSVADALRRVPGVTLAQSGSFGGTTALFLRGGESKYVKVLIDGVPVNNPGGEFDFGSLTTDNVERIEVVRGPASVLYGADAVVGVVQVFTRRGAGPTRASIAARAGTYDARDLDGNVSGGTSVVSWSAGLARHQTRGIYAFNNALRESVASGAVTLMPDARTELRLSARYTDYRYHYPTDGSGTPVDSNAFRTEERTQLGLEVGRTLADRVSLHLSLASNAANGGTDDQAGQGSTSSFVSLDRVRRRGADLRTDVRLAEASTLTLGMAAEQQDQRSQSQATYSFGPSNSLFAASRTNRAVYGQILAGTWAGRLSFTLGGRVDDNERFGTFATYRAAASAALGRGLQLRGSVGSAFREPTFFENYATGFVKGNPNLEPERTRSIEVGLRQSLLDGRLTLAAAHFRQRFANMIDYAGGGCTGGYSYCNVASAQANGQEFEVDVRAGGGVQLGATLTHLDARVREAGFDTSSAGLYRDGQPLVRRPRTSATLDAAYDAPGRGRAMLLVHYVGRRQDRDYRGWPPAVVELGDYARVDLGGELPLTSRGPGRPATALTLRVENLFDREYQSVFNFLSPRRTVLGGVRAEF
jgi:vitamin B12 transporter